MKSASAQLSTFTAALVTPRGRGAVATWRIQGTPTDISRLPFVAAHRGLIHVQPIGRIWFGHWHTEEVVLTRTGFSTWELSLHGGRAAVQRVRQHLEQLGCAFHTWEELLSSEVATLQAEFVCAATQTATWTTTELLLRHPTRKWIAELEHWQLVFERSPTKTYRLQFVSRCEEWLSWSRFGRHLTVPYKVALVGEPNVGKSSLLNRLAGFERAIVQDRPGTTRDLVTVDATFSGFPFCLTDTAGLRETSDHLEAEGISRTHRVLKEADLIIHLVDLSSAPSVAERENLLQFPHAMLVAHKSDRSLHPLRTFPETTPQASSLTGAGIDRLTAAMVSRLIPRMPNRQTVFPVSDRQIDLLRLLHERANIASPEMLSAIISELLSQNDSHLPSKS